MSYNYNKLYRYQKTNKRCYAKLIKYFADIMRDYHYIINKLIHHPLLLHNSLQDFLLQCIYMERRIIIENNILIPAMGFIYFNEQCRCPHCYCIKLWT